MKTPPSEYEVCEWHICVQISAGRPSSVASGFAGSGGDDIPGAAYSRDVCGGCKAVAKKEIQQSMNRD